MNFSNLLTQNVMSRHKFSLQGHKYCLNWWIITKPEKKNIPFYVKFWQKVPEISRFRAFCVWFVLVKGWFSAKIR